MSDTTRLFVALPMPEPLKPELARLRERLRERLPFRKWTHPDDVHITLQFLGETAASTIRPLDDLLRRSAAGIRPFTLELSGIGQFGSPLSPSVLWAGVQGDLEALARLQQAVTSSTAAVGFKPEDRPYRPHITLARKYDGPALTEPPALGALAPHTKENPPQWRVDEMVLYVSHLGRTPMYEPLKRYPLGGMQP